MNRILFLTQIYWPDEVASAQYLHDLVNYFSTDENILIYVITSKRNYENSSLKYATRETFSNVKIFRVNSTGFGKKNIFGRIIDIITFYINLVTKLINLYQINFTKIICLTNPPLISFFGMLYAKIKKAKFYCWILDLQPELSISSGLIKNNSSLAKFLFRLNAISYNSADLILSLDHYMSAYLKKKYQLKNVNTYNLWPIVDQEIEIPKKENPFLLVNNLIDKFIIMYSGNHSIVHDLSILLITAQMLNDYQDIQFVFIGEGVRKLEVTKFKEKYNLNNILQLPFLPRSKINLSLGSADLQVVIMGENQNGFTHPSKIYTAMMMGNIILYIGPNNTYATDIIDLIPGNIKLQHNQPKLLVDAILHNKELDEKSRLKIKIRNKNFCEKKFNPKVSMKKIKDSILLNDNQ